MGMAKDPAFWATSKNDKGWVVSEGFLDFAIKSQTRKNPMYKKFSMLTAIICA
jgi:hypothetical protein